jgi:hypothetical protein
MVLGIKLVIKFIKLVNAHEFLIPGTKLVIK